MWSGFGAHLAPQHVVSQRAAQRVPLLTAASTGGAAEEGPGGTSLSNSGYPDTFEEDDSDRCDTLLVDTPGSESRSQSDAEFRGPRAVEQAGDQRRSVTREQKQDVGRRDGRRWEKTHSTGETGKDDHGRGVSERRPGGGPRDGARRLCSRSPGRGMVQQQGIERVLSGNRRFDSDGMWMDLGGNDGYDRRRPNCDGINPLSGIHDNVQSHQLPGVTTEATTCCGRLRGRMRQCTADCRAGARTTAERFIQWTFLLGRIAIGYIYRWSQWVAENLFQLETLEKWCINPVYDFAASFYKSTVLRIAPKVDSYIPRRLGIVSFLISINLEQVGLGVLFIPYAYTLDSLNGFYDGQFGTTVDSLNVWYATVTSDDDTDAIDYAKYAADFKREFREHKIATAGFPNATSNAGVAGDGQAANSGLSSDADVGGGSSSSGSRVGGSRISRPAIRIGKIAGDDDDNFTGGVMHLVDVITGRVAPTSDDFGNDSSENVDVNDGGVDENELDEGGKDKDVDDQPPAGAVPNKARKTHPSTTVDRDAKRQSNGTTQAPQDLADSSLSGAFYAAIFGNGSSADWHSLRAELEENSIVQLGAFCIIACLVACLSVKISLRLYQGSCVTESANISQAWDMTTREVWSFQLRAFFGSLYQLLLFVDCVAIACLQYTVNCCLVKELVLAKVRDIQAEFVPDVASFSDRSTSPKTYLSEASSAANAATQRVEDAFNGLKSSFSENVHNFFRDDAAKLEGFVFLWVLFSLMLLFPFVVKSRENWLMLEVGMSYSKGERVGTAFGILALLTLVGNLCLSAVYSILDVPHASSEQGHHPNILSQTSTTPSMLSAADPWPREISSAAFSPENIRSGASTSVVSDHEGDKSTTTTNRVTAEGDGCHGKGNIVRSGSSGDRDCRPNENRKFLPPSVSEKMKTSRIFWVWSPGPMEDAQVSKFPAADATTPDVEGSSAQMETIILEQAKGDQQPSSSTIMSGEFFASFFSSLHSYWHSLKTALTQLQQSTTKSYLTCVRELRRFRGYCLGIALLYFAFFLNQLEYPFILRHHPRGDDILRATQLLGLCFNLCLGIGLARVKTEASLLLPSSWVLCRVCLILSLFFALGTNLRRLQIYIFMTAANFSKWFLVQYEKRTGARVVNLKFIRRENFPPDMEALLGYDSDDEVAARSAPSLDDNFRSRSTLSLQLPLRRSASRGGVAGGEARASPSGGEALDGSASLRRNVARRSPQRRRRKVSPLRPITSWENRSQACLSRSRSLPGGVGLMAKEGWYRGGAAPEGDIMDVASSDGEGLTQVIPADPGGTIPKEASPLRGQSQQKSLLLGAPPAGVVRSQRSRSGGAPKTSLATIYSQGSLLEPNSKNSSGNVDEARGAEDEDIINHGRIDIQTVGAKDIEHALGEKISVDGEHSTGSSGDIVVVTRGATLTFEEQNGVEVGQDLQIMQTVEVDDDLVVDEDDRKYLDVGRADSLVVVDESDRTTERQGQPSSVTTLKPGSGGQPRYRTTSYPAEDDIEPRRRRASPSAGISITSRSSSSLAPRNLLQRDSGATSRNNSVFASATLGTLRLSPLTTGLESPGDDHVLTRLESPMGTTPPTIDIRGSISHIDSLPDLLSRSSTSHSQTWATPRSYAAESSSQGQSSSFTEALSQVPSSLPSRTSSKQLGLRADITNDSSQANIKSTAGCGPGSGERSPFLLDSSGGVAVAGLVLQLMPSTLLEAASEPPTAQRPPPSHSTITIEGRQRSSSDGARSDYVASAQRMETVTDDKRLIGAGPSPRRPLGPGEGEAEPSLVAPTSGQRQRAASMSPDTLTEDGRKTPLLLSSQRHDSSPTSHEDTPSDKGRLAKSGSMRSTNDMASKYLKVPGRGRNDRTRGPRQEAVDLEAQTELPVAAQDPRWRQSFHAVRSGIASWSSQMLASWRQSAQTGGDNIRTQEADATSVLTRTSTATARVGVPAYDENNMSLQDLETIVLFPQSIEVHGKKDIVNWRVVMSWFPLEVQQSSRHLLGMSNSKEVSGSGGIAPRRQYATLEDVSYDRRYRLLESSVGQLERGESARKGRFGGRYSSAGSPQPRRRENGMFDSSASSVSSSAIAASADLRRFGRRNKDFRGNRNADVRSRYFQYDRTTKRRLVDGKRNRRGRGPAGKRKAQDLYQCSETTTSGHDSLNISPRLIQTRPPPFFDFKGAFEAAARSRTNGLRNSATQEDGGSGSSANSSASGTSSSAVAQIDSNGKSRSRDVGGAPISLMPFGAVTTESDNGPPNSSVMQFRRTSGRAFARFADSSSDLNTRGGSGGSEEERTRQLRELGNYIRGPGSSRGGGLGFNGEGVLPSNTLLPPANNRGMNLRTLLGGRSTRDRMKRSSYAGSDESSVVLATRASETSARDAPYYRYFLGGSYAGSLAPRTISHASRTAKDRRGDDATSGPLCDSPAEETVEEDPLRKYLAADEQPAIFRMEAIRQVQLGVPHSSELNATQAEDEASRAAEIATAPHTAVEGSVYPFDSVFLSASAKKRMVASRNSGASGEERPEFSLRGLNGSLQASSNSDGGQEVSTSPMPSAPLHTPPQQSRPGSVSAPFSAPQNPRASQSKANPGKGQAFRTSITQFEDLFTDRNAGLSTDKSPLLTSVAGAFGVDTAHEASNSLGGGRAGGLGQTGATSTRGARQALDMELGASVAEQPNQEQLREDVEQRLALDPKGRKLALVNMNRDTFVTQFFYPRPKLFAKNGIIYKLMGVVALLVVGFCSFVVIWLTRSRQLHSLERASYAAQQARRGHQQGRGGPIPVARTNLDLLQEKVVLPSSSTGASRPQPLEGHSIFTHLHDQAGDIQAESSPATNNLGDQVQQQQQQLVVVRAADSNQKEQVLHGNTADKKTNPSTAASRQRRTTLIFLAANNSFFLEGATLYMVEWVSFLVISKILLLLIIALLLFPSIAGRNSDRATVRRVRVTKVELLLVALCWLIAFY
ncbi:unnamed protein product [Amoebophrya sp. A25]|nr:unnamed protein product [Amoebophrya sp. A25]|eukprot:GSA25T00001163001.1